MKSNQHDTDFRIDSFSIRNFMGFEERDFSLEDDFTLFVGENGSGKSTVLEALARLIYPWLTGTGEGALYTTRHGLGDRVRLIPVHVNGKVIYQESLPLELVATGQFEGKETEWQLAIRSVDKINSPEISWQGHKLAVNHLAEKLKDSAKAPDSQLPVFAFFSARRIQHEKSPADWKNIMEGKPKRADGYKFCLTPEKSPFDLATWLGRQEAIRFQENEMPSDYAAVRAAIVSCLPNAEDIGYSAKNGQPFVRWGNGETVLYSNLSDGQRTILNLVGDVARRAAMLNPQWDDPARRTTGMVLIDEIDMHLHPRWQRRIIDDLKRTFPRIQFVATSHSPFIIQSLEPGELRVLDKEILIEYANRGVEEIVRFIQGVDMPETSERYAKQKAAAKEYFEILRRAKNNGGGAAIESVQLAEAKARLDSLTAHYSDNPALEAFIETYKKQDSQTILSQDATD